MKRVLSVEYPALEKEWSAKNDISPSDVTIGSHRMVWWKGSCGHEWQAIVKNRVHGSGCPYCSGNKVLSGLNDLRSLFPDVAGEWSERNEKCNPEDFTASSNRKVWWKGSCGHEWQARISDRTAGHGCPFCAGQILAGFNDLRSTNPELMEEWSDRNEIDPLSVSARSRQMIWWKCRACGHEWQAEIITKVRGTWCPSCRKKQTDKNYREMLDRRIRKRADHFGLPEAAFRFYADRAGIDLIENEESLLGLALQFYLPERGIAIELTKHLDRLKQRRRAEEIKNDLCLRNRIRLIRVLDPGDREYDDCLCIMREDRSYEALSEALSMVFQLLQMPVHVDVGRDLAEIRAYKTE